MRRGLRHAVIAALAGWLVLPIAASPGADEVVRHDEKGTYLGALFCSRASATVVAVRGMPVPPRSGAVVTFVLPDSPAARADLRRNDVLVRYDHFDIRDGDHLARLIRQDRPNRSVRLRVQRGGKQFPVDVALTVGPALKANDSPAGDGKAGNRGQVSVWATPKDSGKLVLTVEFTNQAGQREAVTCAETAELKAALKKLSQRERNLLLIALQHLRTYSTPAPRTETPTRK